MSGSSDDDRSAAVPSTSKGINTTVCFDVVNRLPTVTPKKYALHLWFQSFYCLWSSVIRNYSLKLYFSSAHKNASFFSYSRLPITRTFKGNRKKFELAVVRVIGSTKQITRKEEMGWGMSASNMNTSKLDKYTVLDTVFKLDWQKSKDKVYMVVKIISMFRTLVHFFPLVSRLKHGSS